MTIPKTSAINPNQTSAASSGSKPAANQPPTQFKPLFGMSKQERVGEIKQLLGFYNINSDYNSTKIPASFIQDKDAIKFSTSPDGITEVKSEKTGLSFKCNDAELSTLVSQLRGDADPTNSKQDGIIGSYSQGHVGDCWFLSTLDNLAESAEGKQIIKETIKNNGNGTFSVKFKGADAPLTVSESELKQGTININGESFQISSGDKDVRILEIAANKQMVKHPEKYGKGRTINGGLTNEAWELLTGKKDSKAVNSDNKDEAYYKDVINVNAVNTKAIASNNLIIKEIQADLTKIKQAQLSAPDNQSYKKAYKDYSENLTQVESQNKKMETYLKTLDVNGAKLMLTPEGRKTKITNLLETIEPSRLCCNTTELAGATQINNNFEKGLKLSGGRNLFENHGYNIIGVDAKTKTISLSDPHNSKEPLTITYDEYFKNKLTLSVFEGLK